MRKFFVLALALIMILSLVACKSAEDETTDSDPIVTDPVLTDPTDTNTPTDTDEPTGTDVTDAPVETDPIETDPVEADKFTEVNETVYVYGTNILNVRKEPSKDSEKMGEMKDGEQVTRTGYNSAWSRILYYGNTYYASSDYLTTSAPLEFADKTDTVYITAEGTLNLRNKPSPNADIVAFLPYGTELSRTGIAKAEDDDGIIWSRIIYNGDVCYASTAFLSEDKPEFTDIDDDFKITNEKVYVVRMNGEIKVEAINIRALPSLSSNSLAVVGPDTELLRVGIAKKADADGITWSKVIYGEKTGYISSSYVTTDAPEADETTNIAG